MKKPKRVSALRLLVEHGERTEAEGCGSAVLSTIRKTLSGKRFETVPEETKEKLGMAFCAAIDILARIEGKTGADIVKPKSFAKDSENKLKIFIKNPKQCDIEKAAARAPALVFCACYVIFKDPPSDFLSKATEIFTKLLKTHSRELATHLHLVLKCVAILEENGCKTRKSGSGAKGAEKPQKTIRALVAEQFSAEEISRALRKLLGASRAFPYSHAKPLSKLLAEVRSKDASILKIANECLDGRGDLLMIKTLNEIAKTDRTEEVVGMALSTMRKHMANREEAEHMPLVYLLGNLLKQESVRETAKNEILGGIFEEFRRRPNLALLRAVSFGYRLLPPRGKESVQRFLLAALEKYKDNGKVLGERIIPVVSSVLEASDGKVAESIEKFRENIASSFSLSPCNAESYEVVFGHIYRKEAALLAALEKIEEGGQNASKLFVLLLRSLKRAQKLTEKSVEKIVLVIRSQLAQGEKAVADSAGCILPLIDQENRAKCVRDLLAWACKTARKSDSTQHETENRRGVKRDKETAYRTIAALSGHVETKEALFGLISELAEESDADSSRHRFQALNALCKEIGRVSGKDAEYLPSILPPEEIKRWIENSPPGMLPAVYTLALTVISAEGARATAGEEQWIGVCLAAVERVKEYAKGKGEKESELILEILKTAAPPKRDSVLDTLEVLLSTERASRRDRVANVLVKTSEHSLERSVVAVGSIYGREPEIGKLFVVKNLAKIVDVYLKNEKPCRPAICHVLPVAEHALQSSSRLLRISACRLADLLHRSCWGLPSDYKLGVHLLNLVLPLLLDEKTASAAISAVPSFSKRLSLAVVSSYLTSGLYHPVKKIRKAFKKAYEKAAFGHLEASSPAQGVPKLLHAAK